MLTLKQILKQLFSQNGNTHDFSPRGPNASTEEPKTEIPTNTDDTHPTENNKSKTHPMKWPDKFNKTNVEAIIRDLPKNIRRFGLFNLE